MRRRGALAATLAVMALAGLLAAPAGAEPPVTELTGVTPLGSDVQRFHYRHGPITVAPGQNLNLIGPVAIEKPPYEGFAIRSKMDLVRGDGSVPDVDVVHLHHAVFVNLSRDDVTSPGLPERFGGAGEEKTVGTMPNGYGYRVSPDDVWAINHMVHNQTAAAETVWLTYDIDFVPADTPRGRETVPVRPLWLDVRNGEAYPVFDVHRRSGGRDGRFIYPRDADDPYPDGARPNEWTVPQRGNLVATAGHVHPGGLWTDLAAVRGKKSKRVFRSRARYFDRRGPISWDFSMTHSDPDWRVGVRKGDRLRLSTTYETKRASWYESMGINVAWIAFGEKGPNPFRRRIDTRGKVTHGHLPENENYGGKPQPGMVDPRELPDGQTLDRRVGIAGFQYYPGGFGLSGDFANPPTVAKGQTLRFENADAAAAGTMHSVTACKPPCNRTTGISYPLANGPVDFDSATLGYGPEGFTAAANRSTWETPKELDPGTYTYFCRIHPFMRGALRVKKG